MSESGDRGTRAHDSFTHIGWKSVVYVDKGRGNDSFTGLIPMPVVLLGSGGQPQKDSLTGLTHGPKKTIREGVNAAMDNGRVVVIRDGKFGENLNIAGRDVRVHIEGTVDLRNQ